MTIDAALAYLLGTDAEHELDRWRKIIRDHNWSEAEPYANSLIKVRELDLPKDSPAYRMLCQGIALASAQLHGIRMSRSEGDWTDEATAASLRPPDQQEPPRGESRPSSRSRDTLGHSAAAFLAEKHRLGGTDKKRMMDFEAALRLFEAWRGSSTSVDSITKRDLGEFRALLTKLPPNHTKRFPGRTLVEIVAASEGLQPLNPLTANSKYLSLIDAFFDWCQSSGRIEENPAKGVRIKLPKSRLGGGVRRGTFTIDHLRSIYSAPLFAGCHDKTHIFEEGDVQIRDHRYWLPLLGLWTGARLNELCQLRTEDVRTIDGILALI
jgi:hypothetical protein